jgi:two-component system, chemotaxis family, sensor kinase Cph1
MTFDSALCEYEPIARIGTTQEYGALLHADRTLTITALSANAEQVLEIHEEDLLGKPLQAVLSTAELEKALLRGQHSQSDETFHNGRFAPYAYEVLNGTIIEWEPIQKQTFVFSPENIKSAASLNDGAQELLSQLLSATGFTRGLLYRFELDGSGVVDAEVNLSNGEDYLGLHYPATDIPRQARELYKKSKTRFIYDSEAHQAEVYRNSGQPPLLLSRATLRGVSHFHLSYLRHMGVRSSCSFALNDDGTLWGLVSLHAHQPTFIGTPQRRACQELVDTFSKVKTCQKAEQSMKLLEEFRPLAEEFVSQTLEQTGNAPLESTLELFNAEGAALVSENEIRLVGKTPSKSVLDSIMEFFRERPPSTKRFQTTSLSQFLPHQSFSSDDPAGLAAVMFSFQGLDYYCLWFKPEIIQEVIWGNKTSTSSDMPFTPLYSFGRWREEKRLHSSSWNAATPLFAMSLIAALDSRKTQ